MAAWLGLPGPVAAGDWELVAEVVDGSGVEELVGRSAGLGLPVARVGERRARRRPGSGPSRRDRRGDRPSARRAASPTADLGGLVVADLSSLWAGPLVGSLLVAAGARVVKVESTTRPDGARVGSPGHFARLDEGKEGLEVDLRTPRGRRDLRRVVDGSDVVVTSARPRAVAQLGLDPEDSVRHGRPRVWLSITGYGEGPGSADRVAFGDDAAAAGGLVVRDERGPCFCADAVADPLTGLAGTAAVLRALADGGDHLLGASMADVAGALVDRTAEPSTGTGGPG